MFLDKNVDIKNNHKDSYLEDNVNENNESKVEHKVKHETAIDNALIINAEIKYIIRRHYAFNFKQIQKRNLHFFEFAV